MIIHQTEQLSKESSQEAHETAAEKHSSGGRNYQLLVLHSMNLALQGEKKGLLYINPYKVPN